MLAADVFRASERDALAPPEGTAGGGGAASAENTDGSPTHKDSTTGASKKKGMSRGRIATAGASVCIAGVFGIMAVSISGPSLMLDAFHERIVVEHDVQYTASKESTILVVGQTLEEGDVPDDVAEKLAEDDYKIGYYNESGNFIEDHKVGRAVKKENSEIAATNYDEIAYEGDAEDDGFIEDNKAGRSLIVKKGDKEIAAADFVEEAHKDVELYNAINKATYDRAKLYYDETANEVAEDLGSNRNDFTKDESFEATVNKKSCNGSDVTIENARLNDEGEEESSSVSSTSGDASAFVDGVADITKGSGEGDATKKAAEEIQDSEALTRSQCDARIYLFIQEMIDVVKDGEDQGKAMKVHDMMNRLTERQPVEIVNSDGKKETVMRSALEAPGLTAVLAANKLQDGSTDDYSLERVTQAVKDDVALLKQKTGEDTFASNMSGGGSGAATRDSVASAEKTGKENGGRHNGIDSAEASKEILEKTKSMVDSAMMSNNFENLRGVALGEAIENGAHWFSSEIARRGSGATPMDYGTAVAYAKLSEEILALDAKADRLERSPFDITSKNTFLGSIVHNFAMINLQNQDLMGVTTGANNFATMLGNAISGLFTPVSADGNNGYLAKNITTGKCEDERRINAVTTPKCQTIFGFDPTIFNDTFNNPEFRKVVEESTELRGNQRVVKDGSPIALAILNNNNRQTDYGMVDGAILEQIKDKKEAEAASSDTSEDAVSEALESVSNALSGIPGLITNIFGMVSNLSDVQNDEVAMTEALGGNYVAVSSGTSDTGDSTSDDSSDSLPDWNTNKWAQAWSAIYRVIKILKSESTDLFAYQNLEFFEGEQDIVAEFLERHNSGTESEIAVNSES